MQSLGNYKKLHISQRDRVTNSSTRNNSEPFIKEHFLTEWKNSLRNQSKLEFYRRVKLNFRLESYMNNTTYHAGKNIACIRSSVHDLNLERGRYASKTVSPTRVDNSCRYFCSGEARERLKILEQLPFSSEPIIESEERALFSCPAYHGIRNEPWWQSKITSDAPRVLHYNGDSSCWGVRQYLWRCYRKRNSRKNFQKKTKDKKIDVKKGWGQTNIQTILN